MSAGPDPTGGGPQGVPSEEELRAAYEAELARITATDMIAQAAVSLLNIGARRIGPPPAPPGAEEQAAPPGTERDLEQVQDSIDAAMALLGILERRVPADQLRPLRDALSRLQMAYAAEVSAAEAPAAPAAAEGRPGAGGPGGGPREGGEGDGGQGDGGEDGGQRGPGGEGGPDGPGGGTGGGGPGPSPGTGGEQGGGGQRRPGPAESSGRLWVPGQ